MEHCRFSRAPTLNKVAVLKLFLEHWIISQKSLLDEMGHMLEETELDVKKLDEVG